MNYKNGLLTLCVKRIALSCKSKARALSIALNPTKNQSAFMGCPSVNPAKTHSGFHGLPEGGHG
jgi:hypothetical protein